MSHRAPVKLAVVGGRRGGAVSTALARWPERLVLAAVCDLDEEVLAGWREKHPSVAAFTDYERMLDEADCDAVFIATPMLLHARQAVQALHAGKHVLSEVIAATTLEECWELVETVEKTGLVYMLAENYCFMRPNMAVLHMVRQGLFGELTYAEGAYIHDCRRLMHDAQGRPTWRGELRSINGNTYPTHSLGPVAQWLEINRTDRLVATATWMTPPACARDYVAHEWPGRPDLPITHGDTALTVIQTERGRVIVIRMDAQSARPHNMRHYHLQGTKGAYLSARHRGESNLIWIDGKSPGRSIDGSAEWEPLERYYDEYDHPWWREMRADAERAGHGGGDLFVFRAFLEAILDGAPPVIDVYDAVTWSSIMPLSIRSIERGNVPVEIPDFRRGRRGI